MFSVLVISAQAHADDKGVDSRINSGFLIIDIEKGDEVTGIRNLVVKLDDIESIRHYSNYIRPTNKNPLSRILIRLNNKHEHLESDKEYILDFAHPTPAVTIYEAIIEALARK
jgi:hypothetical protein